MADPKPRGVAQMGGSPIAPDTSTPPPSWAAPKLRTFGLNDLEEHMSEDAWSIFIACVGWAVHWQDIHDERVIGKISMSSLGLFAAPFVGMGSSNMWPVYQNVVSTTFMNETQDWFEESDEYRKDNSLVWPVIHKLGPLLSQLSKGHNARMALKAKLRGGELDVSFR